MAHEQLEVILFLMLSGCVGLQLGGRPAHLERVAYCICIGLQLQVGVHMQPYSHLDVLLPQVLPPLNTHT